MNRNKHTLKANMKSDNFSHSTFFSKCKSGINTLLASLRPQHTTSHVRQTHGGNAPVFSMGPMGLTGTCNGYELLMPDGLINTSKLKMSKEQSSMTWECLGSISTIDTNPSIYPKRFLCPRLSRTNSSLAQNPTADPQYNCLYYSNIENGVDLKYELFCHELKGTLIFQKGTIPSAFSFKIKTNNLYPNMNSNGHIIDFLDSKENKVFQLSSPLWVDENGKQNSTANYELIKTDDTGFQLIIQTSSSPENRVPQSLHFTLCFKEFSGK